MKRQAHRPNPIAPAKGDFVKGHRALIFTAKHWLSGDIIAATPTRVTVEMDSVIATLCGLSKRRDFTWRPSVARYVDAADRNAKSGASLSLDARPRAAG